MSNMHFLQQTVSDFQKKLDEEHESQAKGLAQVVQAYELSQRKIPAPQPISAEEAGSIGIELELEDGVRRNPGME